MGGEGFFIEREMAEADIDGEFGFVSAQSHGFELDSHQTNSRLREKRGAMSSVDRSVEARASEWLPEKVCTGIARECFRLPTATMYTFCDASQHLFRDRERFSSMRRNERTSSEA